MGALFKRLNFWFDIEELKEFYQNIENNYQHLKWSWNNCKDNIKPEWTERMLTIPGANLGWGWGIQSNLIDLSLPCPPYDISTHPRCEYRNSELATGLVLRLQEKIPYSYRWGLFVQPPGGTVPRHTDLEGELTVHIPIYWDKNSVFEIYHDDYTETITFPPTGHAYVLDTIIPHATFNRSNTNRVGIVFRLQEEYLEDLFSVTGKI